MASSAHEGNNAMPWQRGEGGGLVSRAGRIVLVCLVALVVGGAAAVSASAASPAWTVEGKTLATGAKEAIAETTSVTESFVIKSKAWEVKCPTVKFKEAFIEGEKTRKEKSIVFEGCEAIGSSCSITKIETEPLTSKLVGAKGAYKLEFSSSSGTIMTVSLTGSGCPGSVAVSGTMACNYPEVETEKKDHILEFTLTSGTKLKTGTEEVTVAGK